MKRKTRLVAALLTAGILCMAQGSQMIYAAEVPESTEITEVGSTSSSVSMTYEDEHGDYVPTDNFTVTIPKTLNINTKEDYVYDINVKGTIDADRSVWVCADESITLTLTDETLATTYDINKTQTLTNTLDRIQYTSEEIAEGYIGQGTIAKSPLDYEMECEYAGTLNFYINVINENNIIPGTIQQNGHLRSNTETYLSIIKEHLSEEAYTACEARITSAINNYFNNYSSDANRYDSNYVIVEVKYSTGGISGNPYNFCDISFYETTWNRDATITRSSTVTNGKYYYTYETNVVADKQSAFQIHLRQPLSRTDYKTPTGDWYFDYGGGSTGSITSPITTTDNLSVDLYLSPRCKLILE